MFELLGKEVINETIILGNKVRVSDPCYDIDTWCAGTLDNVLPGEYTCFKQRVDQGKWGVRIANIEVRHKDYLHVDPTELQTIDVGVDSGQCGIYDLDYFIEARKDKNGEDEWYWRVCDITNEYVKNTSYVPFNQSSFWKSDFEKVELVHNTVENKLSPINKMLALVKNALDETLTEEEKEYLKEKAKQREELNWELENEYYEAKKQYMRSKEGLEELFRFTANTLDCKCLVSSSGDGDGSYTCLVGRNNEGKIVSIMIDYYYRYEDYEDYEYENEDNE